MSRTCNFYRTKLEKVRLLFNRKTFSHAHRNLRGICDRPKIPWTPEYVSTSPTFAYPNLVVASSNVLFH